MKAPIPAKILGVFAFACLALLPVSYPALGQVSTGINQDDVVETALASLVNEITTTLAEKLGIDPEILKLETDLIEEVGVDRAELYYALEELYLAQDVRSPDAELSVISEIVAYVDKEKNLGVALRADNLEELAFYSQRVYFLTNREHLGDRPIRDAFSGQRSRRGEIRYGRVDVNIPTSHKEGQIETPWRNIRFLEDPRSHIFVQDGEILSQSTFFQEMKASFVAAEDDILLYVHGFNVTYEEAILRAAQIAVDLDFPGLPIAFTWPSNGKTLAYTSDWADAIWSARHLETFLLDLRSKFPNKKVHVIAHSMGNRILLHGLRLAAARGSKGIIENAILAAPDFDATLFAEQVADEVRNQAKHWTIYTSENDLPLKVARKVNEVARLGFPTPFAAGYEIIDASKIEVSPWNVPENHSYYAVKSRVIADIRAVLAGQRPDARKDLSSRQVEGGSVWAF